MYDVISYPLVLLIYTIIVALLTVSFFLIVYRWMDWLCVLSIWTGIVMLSLMAAVAIEIKNINGIL